ncbi:malectin domain-containing carbohydrate-binding protein [Nocardioides sp. CFH 31398]|uniref:malectin domain-containing carbohydrate-binding protein n=1 Tax=Nocardioides sp. CFH 31398 TaxID=2919579 RepID=UPI001F05E59F|nr:malectin domain-containing carbohydrate-binding protein [Nocardioides sp. CFH 31398]MCH1867532.1 malectin [Nocardioides sp. CFH 31398]
MRWTRTWGVGLGAAAVLLAALTPAHAGTQHDRVVSTNPADTVPVIEDGAGAFGVATVGSTTVVGGSFTRVRPRGGTAVTRENILAFDANGAISSTFTPDIATRVWDVVPAGDGVSVYVGGQFSNVDGLARTNRVARINVSTGQVMTTFRSPGFDNIVTDLQLVNGRLYVGGYFKTVGGLPRVGLVALNPTTGALTDHLDDVTFADVFHDSSSASIPSGNRGVGVEKFAVTPDGSRLVAIGNFRTVSGQPRAQVAVLDTAGARASVSGWSTTRFASGCHPNFPTYTLGVDVSPDGRWFAVATGGAFSGGVGSGTMCDAISRWELAGSAPNQQPTWVDYMGGDTSNAIHVTGSAVYIGGHFRWANDPYAGDAAGPGSVDRKGMAALDPRNGLPFSFNAGKLPLRWGVNRFVSTAQGLWVAHDGDTLGNEATGRLGLMPLAGGKSIPPDNTGSLPGDAFLAGTLGNPTGPSPVLHRINAGGPTIPSLDAYGDWEADQDASSPLRSDGSATASWGQQFSRTAQVPATTPTDVFTDERWDPNGDPRMEWNLPAPVGVPLQVRLYFANGYGGTSQVGQRVFDVAVEGSTVLDDYDIVADAGGDSRGTMRAFDVTSDGNVDIDFSHVAENPLISAIEVVRTDVTPVDSSTDDVYRTSLTTSGATTTTQVPSGGVDWSSARGAFMVDGRLYTGWADGTFTWRSYNGSTFGAPRTVDLNDLTQFAAELPGVRGMWFDRTTGRMYYTMRGQNQLYYRYFTPESSVVGAVRFTVPSTAGIDWSKVTGGFLANGRLQYAGSDGTLRSVAWQDGAVGASTVMSGPDVDGRSWSNGALFLRAP